MSQTQRLPRSPMTRLRKTEDTPEVDDSRIDIDGRAIEEAKAGRVVHSGVDGNHHERPGEASDCHRDPADEVCSLLNAAPPVDVDPHDDRLDKEREAFDSKAKSEDRAEGGGEVQP